MDASALQQAIARRRAEVARLERELGRRRKEVGALVAALTVLQGDPGGRPARGPAAVRPAAPGADAANRIRAQLKTAVRKALRKAMLADAQLGEGFTAKYIAGLIKASHPRSDIGTRVAAVAACLQDYVAEGSLELVQSARGPAHAVFRIRRK